MIRNFRTKLKNIFFQIINPTFRYNPKEGLSSLRRKILIYYFFHSKKKKLYLNEINFIKKHSINGDTYSFMFPYSFIYDYVRDTNVYFDSTINLYYVIRDAKKLYFNSLYDTPEKVQIAYYCAIVEQNRTSPHCYLTDKFKIEYGDIVLDVGAAEGILGFDNIEKIGKLYVFEADSNWMPALEATFAPWKDKVEIVNKYVSDNDIDNNISLDTFLPDTNIDLLKIDVEGAEKKIFSGSKNLLKRTNKINVCTYHRKEDEIQLKNILIQHGFEPNFSSGYVLFVLRELSPPYFCKGLIRATKNQ